MNPASVLYMLILFINVNTHDLPIYSWHSSAHLQHPPLSIMSPQRGLTKKYFYICYKNNEQNLCRFNSNYKVETTSVYSFVRRQSLQQHPSNKYNNFKPTMHPDIGQLKTNVQGLLSERLFITRPTFHLQHLHPPKYNVPYLNDLYNLLLHQEKFTENPYEKLNRSVPADIKGNFFANEKSISITKSIINNSVSKENIFKNISDTIPMEDNFKNESEKISADFVFTNISEKAGASNNNNNSENKLPIEVLPESMPSITRDQEVSFHAHKKESLFDYFTRTFDDFERKFYNATFTKLSSVSSSERQENGISFVQSGLFLYMFLISLSTTVDVYIKAEIDQCTGFMVSDTEKTEIITQIESQLPKSDDDLKFRWSSRLVLKSTLNVSETFRTQTAVAMQLHIDQINETETPDVLYKTLNHMVKMDSGGAMHDTFEEDELSEGICTVLLTTIYLRGRWRSAPTLLNGTWPFRDVDGTPPRSARMIRINDIMLYADLNEWDAEAIEISYATPGLTLLILVPRGRSLRKLASLVAATSVHNITQRMHTIRVAAILPLYTLRMTLLLPNKLQSMGINRLVDMNSTQCTDLRVSHAVQRLMFWAEPGRNAFKDDGIEWDEPPELELMVDRPYIFFVRWYNITLMNGNFVL